MIELHASGYLSERRALSIAGGEQVGLNVVMHRPDPMELARSSGMNAADDSHPGARRWYRNPWIWTGVAVVIAGSATGIAYAPRPRPHGEVQPPVLTSNTPSGGVLQSLRSWR